MSAVLLYNLTWDKTILMQIYKSWICRDGVKYSKHPPKLINIASSVERSSKSVCKSAEYVCGLTFRQKIDELQAPKAKKNTTF